MKIKRVTIHNFKSVSQGCTLEIDRRITPLIGASEAGKTNILQAIDRFFAVDEAFAESDVCTFAEETDNDDPRMVSVTFTVEDSDKKKLAEIDPRVGKAAEFTLAKHRSGRHLLDESAFNESRPQEPWPPDRLERVYSQIGQRLESTKTQLNEVTRLSHPRFHENFQGPLDTVEDWIDGRMAGNAGPGPTAAEEQKRLERWQTSAGQLLDTIATLPAPPPEELYKTVSELKELVEEGLALAGDSVEPDTGYIKRLLEYCPRARYVRDVDVQILPDRMPIPQIASGAQEVAIYQALLSIAHLSVDNLTDGNTTRRERHLREGERYVDQFLKQWTQEKLAAKFVVDAGNLHFNVTGEEGHYGDLSDRREGFRWILSFCLGYSSHSIPGPAATLLLDEPGMHLHASAQKDLLEVFESVGQDCQIIYTTHSPFMLNKNYPERIRAVLKGDEPEGTTVDNKAYRPSKGGYYEPIRTSIGLTLGNSLFIGGRNLIVEGIADQIILTAFARHLARVEGQSSLDLQEVCITPAGGAENVPYFAYLCNMEDMKAALLLDSDGEGDVAEGKMRREGVFPQGKVVRTSEAVRTRKQGPHELEDLIDESYYHEAFLEAYRSLGLDFVNSLPKTPADVVAELGSEEASPQAGAEPNSNRQKKSRKGDAAVLTRTKMYTHLFDKHESDGWGDFSKALVAGQISQRLQDNDVAQPEGDTVSSFARLFDLINEKLGMPPR